MNQKKTYESMFLLDAGKSDFESASEPIRNILARSEAEILSIKPWEERKLAYDIKGHKRGLYVLTYFKADTSRISEIEHDCRLNEQILRVLILAKDSLTAQQINAETPATAATRKVATAVEEQAASKESAETENLDEKELPGEAEDVDQQASQEEN